ncbi:MAG: hypothetical protein R8P61_14415 [Bacteroidia bacterium]|nr:hypothetical protein [Bacteroidia bacterium]
MFSSQRIYTSSLAPADLQKEITEVFQAFESNSQLSITDEQRPFDADFEQGIWSLSPRDMEKGEERFRIWGEIQAYEEQGSRFIFQAKASKRQKWSLFKDSLYGLFLTAFTAFMEVIQEIPLIVVILSIPIMLIFVGVYLKKSQQKILSYRWDQLDKNLGELARPL